MSMTPLLVAVILTQQAASVLVEQLGDPSYVARREATVSLRLLGEEARPALESAASSRDIEVRIRAERLIKRLDEAAMWQASRCRVASGRSMASAILQSISQATNNTIGTGDSFGSFNDIEITMPKGTMSFWQAVDLACDKSGNRVRAGYYSSNNDVVAVAGTASSIIAYSGAIRASIDSTHRWYEEKSNFAEPHGDSIKHRFDISLSVMWEPRLRITAYQRKARVLNAMTPDGNDLAPKGKPTTAEWKAVSHRRSLHYKAKIDPPPWRLRRLSLLRAQVGLMLVGDHAKYEIDPTKQEPKPIRGASILIEGITNLANGQRVNVLVTPDAPFIAPLDCLRYECSFTGIDKDGNTVTRKELTSSPSTDGMSFALTFNEVPHRIVLRYPTMWSARDVEIVWRDVPLPRGDR